jgi:hypothetical protein
MKPTLRAPGTKRSKLKYDILLSSFAFNLNLRRYSKANGQAWKAYWSCHQRFFKLLCVSMKVPVVVRHAREALAAGQSVVLGLQTTAGRCTFTVS